MNAPQAIDGLRDLHLPMEPGWWPPAPGWWVIAVLMLLVLVAVLTPLAAVRSRAGARVVTAAAAADFTTTFSHTQFFLFHSFHMLTFTKTP